MDDLIRIFTERYSALAPAGVLGRLQFLRQRRRNRKYRCEEVCAPEPLAQSYTPCWKICAEYR